jgi:hypothetical protein
MIDMTYTVVDPASKLEGGEFAVAEHCNCCGAEKWVARFRTKEQAKLWAELQNHPAVRDRVWDELCVIHPPTAYVGR